MFTVINSVLLRPLSFPESDRLVTVHGSTKNFGEFWGFSNPDFADVRQESRSLAMAAWTYGGGTINAPGEPEYVDGRQISSELFLTLGIVPYTGARSSPRKTGPVRPPLPSLAMPCGNAALPAIHPLSVRRWFLMASHIW
jgi:hypothetical protein